MLNKLKPKSEFTKNVLTLMTGTTIAQAIPIAISPILTRIYTPEDFGLFALFIAITSVFGSIATGRYELAIMLPKKDENAINILALGLIITATLSLILLIIIICFNDYLILLFSNKEIGYWLYFLPLTVFFIGFFNVLSYFNNRKKYYKDIASATIIKSVILTIVQLIIGWFKGGVSGLIYGEILSRMFANAKLLKNITKDKLLVSQISKVKIFALAKKYKDFPKFSMLAIFANTLSSNLINIFISSFYSVVTLGFYSLSERIMGAPISLIGKSISQVYYQQASQEYKELGSIQKTFFFTAKKLFIIGSIIFGSLFFIIEDLFVFVFGKEWLLAGFYSKILIFLYFCRFVVSPLTVTPMIFNRTKIDLIFQILMLFLILILAVIGIFLELNIENFLYIFSFFYGIYYLMYFLYLKMLVR